MSRPLRSQLDAGLVAFYLVCSAIILFITLPILTILAYSVIGSFDGGLLPSFTLEHYAGVIESNGGPLLLSLQVAVATTMITVVVGVPAAYTLVRYDFRFNSLIRELTILPMAIPGIVIGIGLVRVWGVPRFGLDLAGTTTLIILAHSLFTVPFVIQTTMSALESVDFRRLEESARSLGAGWVKTFFLVIIPHIYTGILSGAVLVFALSMGEFNITFFIYSSLNTTLPIALFGGFRTATVGEASALASLFIGIVLISIVLIQTISDSGLKTSGGNI
jgi:putative spermidine/putrescine transport system permease protein